MTRSIIITAALMAAAVTASPAQAPPWNWALQGGERGVDIALRAAADSSGAIHIAATVDDSASFASRKLVTFGESDAVVARIAADGRWLWAYPVGGSGHDAAVDVETDPEGNIYLLATVQGDSVRIASAGGTAVLALNGETDVVLAKYDAAGNLLWARAGGNPGPDRGAGLAVASDGSVYVTGRFIGTMNIGGDSVTSAGGFDMFVAHFAGNGDLRRLQRGGGTGDDAGTGVGVDGDGNAYLVGEFGGTAEFGGTSITAESERNLFLARLAPDGSTRWVIAEGGAQYRGGQAHIAVSSSGNIHITGGFHGSAVIGGAAFNSYGESDGYLVTYNSQGSPQWAKQFPGAMIQTPSDITTDRNGAVYVTGSSQDLARGNLFVFVFSAAGAQMWAKSDDGATVLHNAREGGIAVDGSGNVYMTGGFGGQINFGGTRLTSAGSTPSSISGSDLFVARLGSSVAGTDRDETVENSSLRVTASAGGTAVRLLLGNSGRARLDLYDTRGALVRTLMDGTPEAGEYHLPVPGDLPQGAYFLVLQADGRTTGGPLFLTR